MKPIFLDIEASSWAFDSYPIEIAWGSTTDDIKSYLINPSEIESWTDWSSNAEKAHGISKNNLLSDGISPFEMCKILDSHLTGRTIYTDAPDFDGMWLFNLFDGCGIEPISINVSSFDELMINSYAKSAKNTLRDLKQILRFRSREKNRDRRHRASWDVEYLVRTWEMTQK